MQTAGGNSNWEDVPGALLWWAGLVREGPAAGWEPAYSPASLRQNPSSALTSWATLKNDLYFSGLICQSGMESIRVKGCVSDKWSEQFKILIRSFFFILLHFSFFHIPIFPQVPFSLFS